MLVPRRFDDRAPCSKATSPKPPQPRRAANQSHVFDRILDTVAAGETGGVSFSLRLCAFVREPVFPSPFPGSSIHEGLRARPRLESAHTPTHLKQRRTKFCFPTISGRRADGSDDAGFDTIYTLTRQEHRARRRDSGWSTPLECGFRRLAGNTTGRVGNLKAPENSGALFVSHSHGGVRGESPRTALESSAPPGSPPCASRCSCRVTV